MNLLFWRTKPAYDDRPDPDQALRDAVMARARITIIEEESRKVSEQLKARREQNHISKQLHHWFTGERRKSA